MNIIQKIIPKNPLTPELKERITSKVAKIVEVFGKNYAKQTILVIVKNKEEEIEKKEIRKGIVKQDIQNKIKYYKKKHGEETDVPNFPEIPEKGSTLEVMQEYCKKMLELGFKPLFPRGKMEPLKPPELRIELTRYVLRDTDYDPYAVYIIKASKGAITAEKERRFKEFEKLNKSIKKLIGKECVLPTASSKIGVRNLNPDFLDKRVHDLNEYLINISKYDQVQENEDFQKFIGLKPYDDEVSLQIFDQAFYQTRWFFWCWGDFKYDKPEDALCKLMTREIWYDIKHDILSALPNSEAARKASIKIVFKAISAAVDAAVPPCWKAAYAAGKPIKDKIIKVLESVIGKILEKKEEINNKIKEGMTAAFDPIKQNIAKLFAAAVHKVVPPIVEPFSFIYKTYSEKAEKLIIEALNECDKDKLKKGTDIMNKIHEDMVKRLNDKVDEQLKIISEELNNTVSFELLRDCFSPMKAIGRIIADFVRMIKPERWSRIAEGLFDYKTRIVQSNGEDVDKILIEMERNAFWEIGWQAYYMDNARYNLRYHIYQLDLGLDSIADVCFDVGKEIIKFVYKRSIKKFVRKFSDYVWGFSMKKGEDEKSWPEKVDEAFMLAYQAAKHKFNKECGNILKRATCDILGGTIVNKVIENVVKTIENVIKPLANLIPENIKEMIDIEEMTKEDIKEVLTNTFEGAVDDQAEPFEEELTKAIDNCELTS